MITLQLTADTPGFFAVHFEALLWILAAMTVLWVVSVLVENASIVDPFWGPGFLLATVVYVVRTGDAGPRGLLVLALVAVWALRLGAYLLWRNHGKGEDYRYRQFRENAGPERYWWYSYFQVFLLQGLLMWLISAPLLGAQLGGADAPLGWIDAAAVAVWLVGFVFEAGSDLQLARFRARPENAGKLLTTGFWKYTRHPNYFGDAAVWWGFGLLAVAAGQPVTALGSILMTALIIKVSGVALLERSLAEKKPGYADYVARTSAFLPWFPRRARSPTPAE